MYVIIQYIIKYDRSYVIPCCHSLTVTIVGVDLGGDGAWMDATHVQVRTSAWKRKRAIEQVHTHILGSYTWGRLHQIIISSDLA